MKLAVGEASRLAVVGLTFAIPAVVAMPQRTVYVNSTSFVATQTVITSSTASTTPGPSLSRKCGFWLPNEIFLNSWWTEHATFTVATEIDYYIQYNNTLVPANSSTRYDGFTASYTVTTGDYSGDVLTTVFTDFATLAPTGLLASMQWKFPGVPTDLISLLPATTKEFTYAMSRFHTFSEITTQWGLEATRTNTVVASPTPYVEPMLGLLFVAYGENADDIVLEDYNFTNLNTQEYTGGLWLEPDVDWPSKVMFDSVPIEYINWISVRNPNISSEYPWLSECTNFVSKQPTGAPTVHIVATTLTHKTSSIIATSPGNFGGVVPTSRVASGTMTSEEKSSVELTTSAVVGTLSTVGQTSGAEKTSASAVEKTSTISVERPSATTADQESPTTAQQVSSTSLEQTSTSNVQQSTSATGQLPPTNAEQAPTSVIDTPTSAATSEAAGSTGASSGAEAEPTYTSTNVASNGGSSAGQSTHAGTTGGAVITAQSSDAPSDAPSGAGPSSAAQPTNTESNGVSPGSSGTTAVSNDAPNPSGTTTNAGSNEATQASSVATIPTNHQAVTSGGFTETQQTGTLASSIGVSPSASQTTVVVAPVLTLGSSTIAPNPSSEYIISSQTLAPGGPAITVGETTYSLATSPSAIVENGQTQTLAPVVSLSTIPQITIGSSVVVANPSSEFVYESQTISAGGPAITAGSVTYSLATSGSATFVVENGATQHPVPSQTAAPAITFGSSVVTANSESAYIVGSQTLEAGGSAIAVGETTYFLVTSASSTFVVQNDVTSALSVGAETTTAAPAITIGSSIVTADSASEFIIGTQTLAPGSSAIEVQGTTYSLATSGSSTFIVENGVTSALPVAAFSTAPVISVVSNAAAPVITVGSTVLTANPASEYIIGTQTLAAGSSAIEISGTTYSLASSATAVIIDGNTTPLSASQTPEIIIAGQTLSPNSALGVQGTIYSLAPSGTAVVINGETSALPTPSTVVSTFDPALVSSVSGNFIIASHTLSPGSELTISGTIYSLPSSPATAVLINHSTQPLPSSTVPPLFAIGSTTLSPGNAVTIHGTTYSIPTSISGTASAEPVVVVDGRTSTLPVSEGLGAAVISGLQGGSLSGSRTVGGSVVATTTSLGSAGTSVQGSAPAAVSTGGARKEVNVFGNAVAVAVVVGAIGMVVM